MYDSSPPTTADTVSSANTGRSGASSVSTLTGLPRRKLVRKRPESPLTVSRDDVAVTIYPADMRPRAEKTFE